MDLVISISENDVQRFVDRLGDEFYADPDSLRRAIRDKSSTNLIHLGTSMKVDLFIAGGSILDEQQMNRRQRVQVATDPDRQWRNILGIVLVQSELDDAYLRDGARMLGVADLLDRAMFEGRNTSL